MEETLFTFEVLDKYKKESGWLFKNTNYFVVLKSKTGRVIERKVSLEQFYKCEIGKKIDSTLYRIEPSEFWYFTPKEAKLVFPKDH